MSIDVTSRGQDTPDTYRGNINSVDYRRPNSSRTDSLNSSVHPTNNVEDINTFPRPEAKYPGYAQMGKRAASYRNWPQTAKQVPNNLMDAGFFYTGQADSVRCFMCGTGLRNWDPEDEPWVEHARWAPECYYVRDKKGQDFINLVQVAVRQQQMQEALEQQSDSLAREATDIAADCLPPNIDTDIQNNTPSTQQQQLPSGRKPPTNAERKNPLLSDAAQSVLAMGYLPRIVKIAVDKVLETKGWDGMSGSNIANVVFDMEESGEIDHEKCFVPKVESDQDWKKKNSDSMPESSKELVEKNTEMRERTMCILCCEERVSITFLPCGHLVSCAQCSPALKNCPVCREGIKGTVRIFFS
nr:baculoviral IAP repeat-containing protein 3-like isoform X2 [Crassostrea virginica]XP_022292110.1 baculoviral IAP repeat-containing protein 3-like isoform X2 [Crassostrea virginica]XP_022292112.1 baculoviral IAP repeat-containing protein 3-like isoform X2 [Crassostrea virginica]XP_022292113.1 baculoviral IAP repeat-containing protein 3-like isoform X2 [Crassostrea virginica]XP_022292114.1 baculoviral IAP repeat-containing protein 3-like isoform X2 [Crassostrea virginica]XP_022292115.1 bacul